MTQRSRIAAGLLAAAMMVTVAGCASTTDDDKATSSAATPSVSVSSAAPSSVAAESAAPSSAPNPSAAESSAPASAPPSVSPAPEPVAPVTRNISELQGETVQLTVGGVLNIVTGDQGVASFRGEVSEQAVAEYLQGRDDGSARFNPGVKALGPGTTTVTMTPKSGGEPIIFTINVS